MQLGMIGLGRMGANMARRLEQAGHQCVGYDIDVDAVKEVAAEGIDATTDLAAFVGGLTELPRAVWIMVPAAYVDTTIAALAPLLTAGDIIIDGGNSWWHDDVDRAGPLAADHGIDYVDVGVSGGVHGLGRGYCLMVGGPDRAVEHLVPIFDALAPGVEAADRTPERSESGPPTSAERGWLHCGPNGAGHFVKMVHNGIEYGMMAAYAEGLNILAKADIGREEHEKDAETAPLKEPQYFQYQFDLADITEVWRRGSVVSSFLLDVTAQELARDPQLELYQGHVSDSGEGRWTVAAAIDEGVPVPVLSAALFQRFSSRGRSDVADKILSAMRAGFGGHAERTSSTR
jgi:6-phosphogluconate dehydrogenase